MSDMDLVLQALSVLSNSNVTSIQSQGYDSTTATMRVRGFLSQLAGSSTRRDEVIDEDEFFHPSYDYDFTDLKDTETYYRGGEVYERPCGWKRYALKVLDKYPDGNEWLGERGHCTETVSRSGEWPVSYHGTSKKGAKGIILAAYEPGSGQVYGRGIYSTPYISEALPYTKTFTDRKSGKKYKVILQNRVNPKYVEKHNSNKYWLVPIPAGLSEKEELDIVEKAIRPYALLLKRVNRFPEGL